MDEWSHDNKRCHKSVVTVHSNLYWIVPSFVTESEEVDPNLVRLSSLGFSGCLSVVRFNSVSPLKEALLRPHGGTVHISGPLVRSNCGSPAASSPYAAHNTPHLSGERLFRYLLVMLMLTEFLINYTQEQVLIRDSFMYLLVYFLSEIAKKSLK